LPCPRVCLLPPACGRLKAPVDMLTPPSAHREVLLRQAPERERERIRALERREEHLACQLKQEKARNLAARREQISLAQRERDAYVANVRALFKMNDAQGQASSRDNSAPSRGTIGSACRERRPPHPAAQTTGPSKATRPAVSEVSTAVPSVAGAEDEDERTESPVGEQLRDSLRNWLDADESEDEASRLPDSSALLAPPCRAAASATPAAPAAAGSAVAARRPAVPRASSASVSLSRQTSSGSTCGFVQRRRPASVSPATAASPARPPAVVADAAIAMPAAEVARAPSPAPSLAPARAPAPVANTPTAAFVAHVPATAARQAAARGAAPPVAPVPRVNQASLRTISAEEKALEQSLMRLDFCEMRRQFSGKDALWRKEAPDNSAEANSHLSSTRQEHMIKASLERLNGLLEDLRQGASEAAGPGTTPQQLPQSCRGRETDAGASGPAGISSARRSRSAGHYGRRAPAPTPGTAVQGGSGVPSVAVPRAGGATRQRLQAPPRPAARAVRA